MADLEAAALSGDLFRPRSHSPTRSESTSSPLNTDDELGSDLSRPSSPHGSNANLLSQPSQPSQLSAPPPSHSGAQTGPKGVISDRRAQRSQARQDEERNRRAVRAEQERRAIVAETVEEEGDRREREEREREAWEREREREEEENRLKWRRQRREELERERESGGGGGGRDGDAALKRGGLREVGKEGFLMAVERPGWVVILIYEPDIPRCQVLLTHMLHLSLNLPPTSTPLTLLRARATSLSFSLLPPSESGTGGGNATDDYDEEDQYEDEPEPKGRPDPDVLPTILAYRDGELERTWVRVDWELKEDGVEGLLRRERILPPLNSVGMDQRDLLGSDEND